MASLCYTVKLWKLVKEHMKTRVGWLRGNIVYWRDWKGLRGRDINLPELTHGKHRLRIQAADVSHKLQGNLLIKSKNEFVSCSAVLSEDAANIIMPLVFSVWLLRPWQKETAATSDQ